MPSSSTAQPQAGQVFQRQRHADALDGAAVLAEHGWVVVVYEVPHCCVFISESMKQVVFDWACAVAQIVLDLNHFCQGNEVEHVPSSLPTE